MLIYILGYVIKVLIPQNTDFGLYNSAVMWYYYEMTFFFIWSFLKPRLCDTLKNCSPLNTAKSHL